MADVTDRAFRQMIAKYSKENGGKLDVIWTEFVSADGLFCGGYDALINDLKFSKKEKPIMAQFFTSSPEMMERASALAVKLGFDGVDINMGCPDKSIEKSGAGAAFIKNPKLAQEIIRAAIRGTAGKIPVSVKTRLGYKMDELETWLIKLLDAKPAMITIHARTRKELSLVPARWERVGRAVEIRNEWAKKHSLSLSEGPLIFGNGDVVNYDDACKKARETGCDGVMIGRGFFGRPDLFAKKLTKKISKKSEVKNRLKLLLEHVKLFEKLVEPKSPKGQGKSFAVMKKHFKAYVSGWDGAKELRVKLMEAKGSREVGSIISDYFR